jgi:hypothetical protein
MFKAYDPEIDRLGLPPVGEMVDVLLEVFQEHKSLVEEVLLLNKRAVFDGDNKALERLDNMFREYVL